MNTLDLVRSANRDLARRRLPAARKRAELASALAERRPTLDNVERAEQLEAGARRLEQEAGL